MEMRVVSFFLRKNFSVQSFMFSVIAGWEVATSSGMSSSGKSKSTIDLELFVDF